jgi:hypothetical protein
VHVLEYLVHCVKTQVNWHHRMMMVHLLHVSDELPEDKQ